MSDVKFPADITEMLYYISNFYNKTTNVTIFFLFEKKGTILNNEEKTNVICFLASTCHFYTVLGLLLLSELMFTYILFFVFIINI